MHRPGKRVALLLSFEINRLNKKQFYVRVVSTLTQTHVTVKTFVVSLSIRRFCGKRGKMEAKSKT